MRVLAGAVAAAAVANAAPSFSVGTVHSEAAPVLSSANAEHIPDSYIIKFKEHVSESGASSHQSWVQDLHAKKDDERLELRKRGQEPIVETVFEGLKHTYSLSGFLGYSGHFDEATIEAVRRHPDVEFIEKDSIVHTMEFSTEDKCNGETEKAAPWGLARVSHRNRLNFGTYNKYLYAENAGEGVDAYVIDTGTNIDHVDFEGRAHWGKTIPSGDADEDGNGHGTHCSGTVAGTKYGVAKKAQVYAVKVLRSNGSGTMSDVVKGVEWAAQSHIEQVKKAKDGKRKGFKGSVANMSLGGGKTTALDRVVDAAVDVGIHFAVAAGNDNADACNYSPAASKNAVTVGATELGDVRSYFSNYGKCTDIFAPGTNILSTWIGSKYATNTISGTSMASPHVCGLLAYYLSLQPARDSEYSVAPITPEKLKANLIAVGTVDAIGGIPADTPNVLAWNGGGCSNYDEIVAAGSYKAKTTKSHLETVVGKVEAEVEKDIDFVMGKAKKFSNKIHDIEEELKGLLEEMSS
ncbi:cerevisin [Plectosphaerella cucumerina]|uniref:Cerevisin n=1 Tax=Plectosphaerella cucumerina TaxID=40658 RepID=A0A8K0TCZ6_9PEZI|nr:cerevisin [Plectosphaerella cucumerina]